MARALAGTPLSSGPVQTVAVDLDANYPGAWMFHCHNEYHLDAGTMTRVDYRL